MPYILKYCQLTNHTFNDALKHNVSTVFYIVSYDVLKTEHELKQLKHGRTNSTIS